MKWWMRKIKNKKTSKPPPTPVPRHINRLYRPLDQEGCNLFPRWLLFELQPGQWCLNRGDPQRQIVHKRKRIPLPDCLEAKLVRSNLIPGWQEKQEPATHRKRAFLCYSELRIPHLAQNVQKGWPIPPNPTTRMGGIGGHDAGQSSTLVRDPLLPGTLLSLRLSRGPTWPLVGRFQTCDV